MEYTVHTADGSSKGSVRAIQTNLSCAAFKATPRHSQPDSKHNFAHLSIVETTGPVTIAGPAKPETSPTSYMVMALSLASTGLMVAAMTTTSKSDDPAIFNITQ